MGEFELIDAIVAELGSASLSPAVVVGPGDDAAVVTVPGDHQLVTSVDTLVSDLHFPALAPPELIAQRALRVSVSDLAAMGAVPLAAVVALVLPKTTEPEWVRRLSRGFAVSAGELKCPVTGGNLTAGQLSISITAQGVVPTGNALLRSGAKSGDEIWVSGALGGAALALTQAGLDQVAPETRPLTAAEHKYYLPVPQIELGIALREIATSAIDISDGLAADLGHIAQRSNVAAMLTSSAIQRLEGASLAHALHGGDDYQLCFTAPPECADQVGAVAADAFVIGRCVPRDRTSESASDALVFLDGQPIQARGFDHFQVARAPQL